MRPAREHRLPLLIAFCAGAVVAASVWTVGHGWRAPQEPAPGAAAAPGPTIALPETAAATDVVQQLRGGGYLLYFRHGNRQKWDSVIAFDIHELATATDGSTRSYRDAVCLSPQGREEAAMIGEVLRLAEIPVGRVLASPLCRSRETAQLAFGRIDATHMALVHTPVVNRDNAAAFKDGLRRVLAETAILPGTNTVITAHENTIINHADLFATGREWLVGGLVQEGGLYVLRRDADGTLHVVHRFQGLGELAAAGITLRAD
jgi:phosphohistidine phosphatase SixA